ncbi:hypothetical protein FRC14_004453 [Serendipita sp. 396]|nr:hypothetical protein FRC14_004453 [Serendipita sp. 396]
MISRTFLEESRQVFLPGELRFTKPRIRWFVCQIFKWWRTPIIVTIDCSGLTIPQYHRFWIVYPTCAFISGCFRMLAVPTLFVKPPRVSTPLLGVDLPEGANAPLRHGIPMTATAFGGLPFNWRITILLRL